MALPLAAVRPRLGPEVEPVYVETRPKLAVVPSRSASANAPTRDRTFLGVGALLLSTILFPMSDMLSKSLATTYPGLQVTWMRYVVLLLVIGPAIARRPGLLRTTRPGLQLVRGLSSTIATSLALVGFVFLPVAEATAIGFCAPLIVIGLAAVVLKECVGWARWACAAMGFVGILIIVQPGAGTFQLATLLPLCSSLFSACTVITTRLGRHERAETTVALSATVGLIVTSVAVAPVWKALDLQAVELGLLMGALAAAASILQVVAYRCAPTSLLAPFSYAQILWAVGMGWFAFGSVPSVAMLIGSAVVILSGCAAAAIRSDRPGRRSWSMLRRDLEQLTPSRPLHAV